MPILGLTASFPNVQAPITTSSDSFGQRANTWLEPSPNLFCGIILRRIGRKRKNLQVGIPFYELFDVTTDMYGCIIQNKDRF